MNDNENDTLVFTDEDNRFNPETYDYFDGDRQESLREGYEDEKPEGNARRLLVMAVLAQMAEDHAMYPGESDMSVTTLLDSVARATLSRYSDILGERPWMLASYRQIAEDTLYAMDKDIEAVMAVVAETGTMPKDDYPFIGFYPFIYGANKVMQFGNVKSEQMDERIENLGRLTAYYEAEREKAERSHIILSRLSKHGIKNVGEAMAECKRRDIDGGFTALADVLDAENTVTEKRRG